MGSFDISKLSDEEVTKYLMSLVANNNGFVEDLFDELAEDFV